MRRYANKKDTVQESYVETLRKHGCICVDIDLSTGIDLLCGYRKTWFSLELKSKGGKLTDRQMKWGLSCDREGLPHFVLKEGEPATDILDKVARLYSARSKPPPVKQSRQRLKSSPS